MGNHVIVMDDQRNKIGSMDISLVCFAAVNKIVKKYTGDYLPVFGDVNKTLDLVYEKCEDYEEVQLLIFINDKSNFDTGDIFKLDEALKKWDMPNENPKKHLVFIRDLVKEYGKVITEYSGVSTGAVAVESIEPVQIDMDFWLAEIVG